MLFLGQLSDLVPVLRAGQNLLDTGYDFGQAAAVVLRWHFLYVEALLCQKIRYRMVVVQGQVRFQNGVQLLLLRERLVLGEDRLQSGFLLELIALCYIRQVS